MLNKIISGAFMAGLALSLIGTFGEVDPFVTLGSYLFCGSLGVSVIIALSHMIVYLTGKGD